MSLNRDVASGSIAEPTIAAGHRTFAGEGLPQPRRNSRQVRSCRLRWLLRLRCSRRSRRRRRRNARRGHSPDENLRCRPEGTSQHVLEHAPRRYVQWCSAIGHLDRSGFALTDHDLVDIEQGQHLRKADHVDCSSGVTSQPAGPSATGDPEAGTRAITPAAFAGPLPTISRSISDEYRGGVRQRRHHDLAVDDLDERRRFLDVIPTCGTCRRQIPASVST